MSGHARITGAEVRARLDHPVIDADAHIVESTELVDEYVREIGGPDVFERWSKRPPRYGPTKMIWWGSPSGKYTADRAMSLLPKYFAERMGECGIDFAHLLTTIGIARFATGYVRSRSSRSLHPRKRSASSNMRSSSSVIKP